MIRHTFNIFQNDRQPILRLERTDNSLDLLVRCGLKYSRGKDQLMCYGENMPLDLLFVRDDDIPDLVEHFCADASGFPIWSMNSVSA